MSCEYNIATGTIAAMKLDLTISIIRSLKKDWTDEAIRIHKEVKENPHLDDIDCDRLTGSAVTYESCCAELNRLLKAVEGEIKK